MDLDDSHHVSMLEDGIMISTEQDVGISQENTTSILNPPSHSNESDPHTFRRPTSLPPKGKGAKRENDINEHHLTKRDDGPRQAKLEPLPYATAQTGLVDDVRMRFHVEVEPSEDELRPEDPRRIHAIYEAFVHAGLVRTKGCSVPSTGFYMGRVDTRAVTKGEVCPVHTEAHWDRVQRPSAKTAAELIDERRHPNERMDSVYVSPSTPFCAALPAGGAIEACRAVLLGKVKNIFAVVRPPRHHAEREDAKGFRFFDNVSIATQVCRREFGERCRKVLILDGNGHHGNGIQQANDDDPNVLDVSLHVHERGRFDPASSYRDERGPYGDHLHCGSGPGLGRNVNIPWSKKETGDADDTYAFQQVVMPMALEFEPDLVIIAAGLDAAAGDMLGGLQSNAGRRCAHDSHAHVSCGR